MPMQVQEREMSSEERQLLQSILASPKGSVGNLRLAINVGAASLFISMGLIVLCWSLIAWLVRLTTGTEIGPHSAVAELGYLTSLLASAVIAVFIAIFWVARRKDERPELLADLQAGRVVDEDYEFTAAMRMQEQEHGGLFYFLRTADDAVLVLFDYESQDIGVQGGDPLTSSFKPCSRLTMVRAPESRLVIDISFAGDPLNAGEPLDMFAHPDNWPNFEEICDVPWEDLEAKYCSQ